MSSQKFIFFNGHRFCRDNRSGYYVSTQFYPPKALHRYVWECEHGAIPQGMEIHHKDFNKANNAIDNLACLTIQEHKRIHSENPTKKQLEYRQDVSRKITFIEKAREWHQSEEGREWHRKHAKECIERNVFTKELTCKLCGKKFIGDAKSKFCCKAHKAKWRREQHMDDEVRRCANCGKEFKTNRFKKRAYCDVCKGLVISKRATTRALKHREAREAICAKCHNVFTTTQLKPWLCPSCKKEYRNQR